MLLTFKKSLEDLSELYDIGFDLYEGKYKLSGHIESLLETSLKSHYTKEGVDWVMWFIFEADFGSKDFSVKNNDGDKIEWGATDENNNPICYSYESLYKYIKQYERKRKK